ncbi:hypothetical protein ACQEVZ_30020 [Dactylosporangium sp. CA-152071]|uniref:hypothetical protein n=1 Tax=Dactylosporangium sp. CA-152071 TaxID=3239933 RepID=UPI003D91635F
MSPTTTIRGSRLLTPAARQRLKEASAAAMSYRGSTSEACPEDEMWAVEVLARRLDPHDPTTAPPDRTLVYAAVVYATAPGTPDEYEARLAWARYAYTASRLACPAGHPSIWRATGALAQVLSASTDPADAGAAISVQRELVALLGAAGRPAVLAGTVLARLLHDAGHCTEALHEATTLAGPLLQRPGLLYGDRLLAVAWLGVLLAGCHRHDEATALLTRVTPHRRRVRSDAMFRHVTHRLDTYAPRHAARHHDGQPCPHPACTTGREPLSTPVAAPDRLEILP